MLTLRQSLEKSITGIVNGITDELQEKIYDAFSIATSAAQAQANDTVFKWGAPVDRDNRAAGGFVWSTYKAICRRDGVFTNSTGTHNFNEQLVEPVIRQLTGPWESVFARRIPGILNSLPVRAGQILMSFHNDVERRALRNGASIASFQMLKHQISTYKETLKEAMNEARGAITTKQRDINREFEPRITECMMDAYLECVLEHGPGSFRRMKNHMAEFVQEKKATMFANSVDYVRNLITDMLKSVKDMLLERIDHVFLEVQRDYTGVVIGQEDGNDKDTALPREQRACRKEILVHVDSAEMVFKRAVGLETEPEPEPMAKEEHVIKSDEDDDIKMTEGGNDVKKIDEDDSKITLETVPDPAPRAVSSNSPDVKPATSTEEEKHISTVKAEADAAIITSEMS